jgi:hypothetical protein
LADERGRSLFLAKLGVGERKSYHPRDKKGESLNYDMEKAHSWAPPFSNSTVVL